MASKRVQKAISILSIWHHLNESLWDIKSLIDQHL